MAREPDDHQHRSHPFEGVTRTLERILLIILGTVTIAILVGAVFLMLKMDNSSQSQGGRFYVAIGALILLGFVDSQFGWVIKRHAPFSITTTSQERRYYIISLVIMFVSALVLIGLALLLP